MTVASDTARKNFDGDGTTSAFSTNPVIFYDTDTLNVKVVTTATGGFVLLVENTDYTVSGGAGAIGTVDLSGGSSPYGAPPATEYVNIIRDEPYLQADDFVNNSASDAEVIEARYDKVTMEIQQLLEITARSIKFPDIETAATTLPNYVDRASKFLFFDSAGDLAVSTGSLATAISDFWYTVLDDTTAAASHITLGLVIGTDVQAWDAQLDDIAALAVTDGNIIVGDGTNWVAESGATARTSLGVAIGTDVQAFDAQLADLAGLAVTDGNFIVGDGANWVVESGATARTSIGLGAADTVAFASVTATTTDSNFSTTGETILASGTTAQEPSGTAGGVRIDSDTDELTYSDGTTWFTTKKAGRETIWLPAHSWIPNTTNGPALIDNESTTNKVMYKTLDFDMTTSESAQFAVMMPKNWNLGVIRARPIWTAASGTGTVTFTVSGVAISNDGAIDTAFGTGIAVTDTLLATGDMHDAGETADITIAGTPALYDLIFLRIERTISDTLSADAKLVGCHIYITTNAASDD